MNVGDLVRHKKAPWRTYMGIVIRQIPGTDERQIVLWTSHHNERTTTPKRDLEVISESR